jgi:hypothetical protein
VSAKLDFENKSFEFLFGSLERRKKGIATERYHGEIHSEAKKRIDVKVSAINLAGSFCEYRQDKYPMIDTAESFPINIPA